MLGGVSSGCALERPGRADLSQVASFDVSKRVRFVQLTIPAHNTKIWSNLVAGIMGFKQKCKH